MAVPTISYSVLPFGDSDWLKISPEVHRQLPLRNLHWKSASRSIRTIQSLHLNFKPLSSFDDTTGLLERPYLNLLFVLCDDNEMYRATVRLQIREWLDSISAKHKEWLIVHVSAGRSAGSKFYQRKGSVVDKIRADFNTEKRDRCVQVAQFVSAEDPTTWAEFTAKLKEGVIATFSANVLLYEEDVKKADSQRQLAGWQYASFFLQKEALAVCFEGMGLVEDALIQYDELEASFFQTLKDNRRALFASVGGSTPGDDALPLLSTTNKPYRQLLLSNTISIFDFRIYVFARQASMLRRLGRISEIAKRGAYFISTFTRTLRENQATLGSNFVESWTYSACLNIVDECGRWAEDDGVDQSVLDSFVGIKAELLELARKQLDKLGISSGHLPLVHPFSMSLNETPSSAPISPTSPTAPKSGVTRHDLFQAVADVESFDKLYVELTNRSIGAYSASGRKRCGLKLHATLAALEDLRNRPLSSQKLYSHLPAHYVDQRWIKIESSLLSQCTRLQSNLDMPKERLLSTLALVRAGIEFGDNVWHLEQDEGEDGAKDLAAKLMKDVYELSGGLNKDFAAIGFPTFSMRLASDRGATAVDEDGLTVGLWIRNLLPCSLKIDEVRLKFSSVDGDQIWFTAAGCLLSPGETEVTLFSPTPVTGRLALELSQIRFSRIIFQYSHRPNALSKTTPDWKFSPQSSEQPAVHFPRDPQALDIYTEFPQSISLDEPRHAILCVSTGRNELVRVDIKVTTTNPDVILALHQTKILSGSARLGAVAGEESFHLEGVPTSSITGLQLPLIGPLLDSTIELSIVAEYFTSKRPTTRRVFRRAVQYNIALPLAVNVQDYFRPECLLSKFVVVTADNVGGLRIKSAELEAVDLVVKACRKPDAPTIALFPRQTSNFLFKINRPKPRDDGVPFVLRLRLTYCTMQGEFEARVRGAVSGVLVDTKLKYHEHWFRQMVLDETESVIDVHSYAATVELTKLIFDQERWTSLAKDQFLDQNETNQALDALRRVHERLREADVATPPEAWRTLTIPIELPSLTVLNLVHFLPASQRIEVGQPLKVTLSIRPTFSWARTPLPKRIALTYDINASLDDWLISGRKRGEFEGEENEETEIILTLIPLRPGDLFLPSVAITTSPIKSDPSWTCETQHLNAGQTVEILPITARTTFNIAMEATRSGILVDV